jgi:hypothetical protein
MSRKIFVVIAGLAFLMCLISMYFGVSIFNSNDNIHVEHLNDMDRFSYYDAEMVPGLTRLAAIVTMPFLLAIIVLEIYVAMKTKIAPVKRIALSLTGIALTVLIIAGMTLASPLNFDFSHWGFVWIFAGLFTIAGNGVSVFLKPKF